MPIVLALGHEGWRTEAKVAGAWPAVAAPAGVSPALETALRTSAPPPPSLSLWAALQGALVGGAILNLMPCVFPILAVKVMGFARHADNVRAHRVAGMAYSAGVVVSFIVLGAAIVALRAAGEQLGWGFQLQSPLFIAALAALFTLTLIASPSMSTRLSPAIACGCAFIAASNACEFRAVLLPTGIFSAKSPSSGMHSF